MGTNTLTTNKPYVLPGTYIGEDVQPGGVSITPQTRVPTYVGRGSRYIEVRNSGIIRGFVNDVQLSFTRTSPFTAALAVKSDADQSTATLVDSHGIALRNDQWLFVDSGKAVVIADSTYVDGETYFLSYQGSDRTLGDVIPTADLRTISAIGNHIDQDQYKRGEDFFVETAVLAPEPTTDASDNVVAHANAVSTLSGVTKTAGAGTGTVTLDEYAEYNHKYSRAYAVTVVSVSGTATTFKWTSTPESTGVGSAPAIPLAPSIAAPTFTVDSTIPQTQYATLEYGITVVAQGTFAVGDTFKFNGLGPSLVEVDSTLANTNQYALASASVPDADNALPGNLAIDATGFTGSSNLSVNVELVNVDLGTVSATVPTASIEFDTVADGDFYTITNGRSGTTKQTVTFEFDTDKVQAVAGSTLVTAPVTAATSAAGSIAFTGTSVETPADGTIVTICDGVRTVSFEFDNDGILNVPTATRVVVDAVAGSQSANTAANLATAINASTLRITASTDSSNNGNVGKVLLQSAVVGSVGNVGIVVSGSGVSAIGLTGGSDSAISVAGAIANFVAAVNASKIGIVAEIDSADAAKVNLTHGARLTLTAQPSAGDQFTVNTGAGAKVFEYVTTGTPGIGHAGITIGSTLQDTVDATVEIISVTVASKVVAGSSTITVAPTTGRNAKITASAAGITVIPSVVDDTNGVKNGNATIAFSKSGRSGTLTGFTGGTAASDSLDRITFAWGVAGETFASGTSTIVEGKTATIYDGIKVGLKGTAAVAAKGTITLTANPTDGKTVVITDGIVATPVTFEFDSNATVVAGHVAVLIGANATATAKALATAIQNSALQYNVEVTGTSIKLTAKRTGTGPASSYNTPIVTDSSAVSVVGMAGGGANYAVGDKYSFTVKAPRTFTVALDDRTTELTIQQIGTDADADAVVVMYSSNTFEGGLGTDIVTPEDPTVTLPGQIKLVLRNLNRFAVGDKFTVKHVNNGRIFWTLDAKVVDSFTTSSVLTDRNGTVTGAFGGYYVTLSNTPYAGTLSVAIDGVIAPASAWSLVEGTSIVKLNVQLSDITSSIVVSYTCTGNEPDLGDSYYISGNYLRPKAMYNVPQVFYDLDSAREALAPVTTDNDVYIACDIAFSQANPPLAVAVIQVSDSDDDGQIAPSDYDAAIKGATQVSYITDFIPLRMSNFTSKTLAFNVKAADPFEKRECEVYFGLPVGTPIGNNATPDSVIYFATKTLQVFGKSYAHGTRILVGPRWAKKTITLSDDTVTQVTLDGSFVAAGVAACVAGAPNYSTTLLKSQLLGFDEIETFGRTINEQLGAAGIIFFSNSGSGVYTFEEDQTVDFYSPEFHEILPMRTKQDVTRIVRAQLDASVIGMVPNTRGDATSTIAAKITQVLLTLINTGVIAPYQDENGNERSINSGDVQVTVDANDTTKYTFFYTYYTRFAIKRLFGLYSVNKKI